MQEDGGRAEEDGARFQQRADEDGHGTHDATPAKKPASTRYTITADRPTAIDGRRGVYRICPRANAACCRTSALGSLSAAVSPSIARASRICPSANAACSRTSALAVLERDDQRLDRARVAQLPERERGLLAHVRLRRPSAPRSADRPHARSRIWPSANAACSRTSAVRVVQRASQRVDRRDDRGAVRARRPPAPGRRR